MLDFEKLLKEELLLALGCTEPIAIALTAAHAGALTKEKPEQIDVYASGSIIKNANSVYVPHSGGRQGALIAAALGALVAQPEKSLKVLEGVTDDILGEAVRLLSERRVRLHHEKDAPDVLFIRVKVTTKHHEATAVISKTHTRLVQKTLDGQTIFVLNEEEAKEQSTRSIYEKMDIPSICAYADSIDFDQAPAVLELLEQQIRTNMGIAQKSIKESWGQQVGKTLFAAAKGNIEQEAIAYAAAGSDARMAGCDHPVTINSGSGNQGITCSVPVIYIAEHSGVSHDKLLRSLLVSNLTALYQKSYIGKLSAFCGAICASAAAACGVAYMKGLGAPCISGTLCNTLCASGGIVCDGAKGSCALKIATALQNAFLGLHMSEKGQVFKPGDGIMGDTAEDTVRNIGRVAREGMVETDRVILNIMTEHANRL